MSKEGFLPEGAEATAAGAGDGPARRRATPPRLRPINRQQWRLRPVVVDQLVGEEHPVRAIWEFVGRMDLSPFYEAIAAVEGVAGRTPFDPRLLISLWIYAYSEGISSARAVARLCAYHPGFQWLTGMEMINYHTLSDFRVDHKAALDELFTQALGLLSAEGLITLQRVMHDGTKIRACAGRDTFRREETIPAHLALARQQVEQLGDADEEEPSPRVAAAAVRAARERAERLELAVEELHKLQARQRGAAAAVRVSESDPQARIMKQAEGGYAPSYNVQISTDAAAGIIVGMAATQSASDYEELLGAVQQVEERLEQGPEQVVVDGGFTSRGNILAMAEQGVDLIGSLTDHSAPAGGAGPRGERAARLSADAFHYDPVHDCYTCPAEKTLPYVGKEEQPGQTRYRYRAAAADCQACPLRAACCPQATRYGRSLERRVDHPAVQAFVAKMQTAAAQAIYKQRAPVAEFPNAWLKAKLGLRQFRLRGLIKVGLEALWAGLTYNIQQWIRLRWRTRAAAAAA